MQLEKSRSSNFSALLFGIAILSVTAFISVYSNRFALAYLFISTVLMIFGSKEENWNAKKERDASIHATHLGLLLITVFVLYYPVLQSWWIEDDPAILRHIIEYPIIDNFFDSNVWRSYMPNNLTPFLIFSLGIDFKTFGLEPHGYYIHQILTVCTIIFLGYILLTKHFPPLIATLILIIFLTSLPLAVIVQQLMTRHYLDGLLLSLMMLLFYKKSVEEEKPIWLLPSVCFYILACTAKEIYVPLFVLLPWTTNNLSLRKQWLYMTPFFCAAIGYVSWRVHMLKPENMISGYGSLYSAEPIEINDLTEKVFQNIGAGNPITLSFIIASFSIYAFYTILDKNRYHKLTGVLVAAIVVFAPLTAVTNILLPRMMILVAAFIILIGGIGLYSLSQKHKSMRKIVLLTGLCWIGLNIQSVANEKTWKDRDWIERYRQEGEFILTADVDQTLVYPIGPQWFYTGLAWIREHYLANGKGPDICYDPCLCLIKQNYRSVIYQNGAFTTFAQDKTDCQLRDAPLSIHIIYDSKKGIVNWSLGPYTEGRWSFLLEPGAAKVPVPRSGHFPMYRPNPLYIRVLYESPEGWRVTSRCLRIDPAALDHEGRIGIVQHPTLKDPSQQALPGQSEDEFL